jgi:hypothetical protein
LAKPITDAINSVPNEMATLRTAILGERQAVFQMVQTEVANAFAAQTQALEAVVKGLPTNAKAGSGVQTNPTQATGLTKGRIIKRTIIVLAALAGVIWLIVKFVH